MSNYQVKELVEKLNHYRDAYYNYNEQLVTDEQYDELFDKLKRMEDETGIILSNSPTATVGYAVQDNLKKVQHSHAMLSLGKTKDTKEVLKFINDKDVIASLKMDGLTCSLHYNENGDLVSAETRGNGIIGEDITENAKQLSNIPLHINNNGVPLTIDGEVIVDYETFNKINEGLENKFAHPRNLASGSIRQLDTKITKERQLKFIPWRVIEGSKYDSMFERLQEMIQFGFDVVPSIIITGDISLNIIKETIEDLKETADFHHYPIDGIVFAYDDIKYGESLGETSHHPLHSLAYKFYDDCYETTLKDIEWNTTRTGMVAPVAVFDPVDLDGAITTRATLHNVSIMKELELGIGDTITVFRANQVIPKVNENLTKSNTYKYPTVCPVCGEELELRQDGIAEVLYCINPECSAKNLAKFIHFVSKEGVDIKGLSEATLEKFITLGYIKKYADIYHLNTYRNEIPYIEGFGEKSFDNLISAIEESRSITLDKYLVALGIPNIGKSAAKTLAKFVNGDYNAFIKKLENHIDLTQLEDFGEIMENSVYDWFQNNYNSGIEKLIENEFTFVKSESSSNIKNEFISGKTFVVTGAFKTMKRNEIEKIITDRGGKLTGSVSKNTDYLLTNETTGTTKYNKAKELGIPIMNESEFFVKIGLS